MTRSLTHVLAAVTCVMLAGCNASAGSSSQLSWPLERAAYRNTPLHFGLYVTPDPEMNPISPPERFTGFHAGTDFEITPDETDGDVEVFAICSGNVVHSGFVEGYGGLIAEACIIDNKPVVVLYGHLQIDSLPANQSHLVAGTKIGLLGAQKSHDTDDNRKHLHLGIHRGTDVVYLGYVQKESDLKDFIDPQTILQRFGVAAPVELPE